MGNAGGEGAREGATAEAKAKAQRGISRCVSLDLSGPMAAVTSCGLSFLLRFIAFASVSPRHDEVQELERTKRGEGE